MQKTQLVPEPWVPDDVVTYQSLHWNVKQSLDVLRETVADFQGDEALDLFISNQISSRLGVDVLHEVVPRLTGDFVRMVWYDEPSEPTGDDEADAVAEFQRETSALAVRVKDGEAFAPLLDQVAAEWGAGLRKEEWEDAVVYVSNPRPTDEEAEPDERRSRRRRRRRGPPQVCFAMIGDYLVIADRLHSIERLVEPAADGMPLADSPAYEAAVASARGSFGGGAPMVVSFTQMDRLYEYRWSLLQSDLLRRQLRERFADRPIIMEMVDALEQYPLPPWSRMTKYMAPVISVIADGDSGPHYTQFRLRPE